MSATNRWTRWACCPCQCRQKYFSPPRWGRPFLASWRRMPRWRLCDEPQEGGGPGERACEPALCRGSRAVLSPCQRWIWQLVLTNMFQGSVVNMQEDLLSLLLLLFRPMQTIGFFAAVLYLAFLIILVAADLYFSVSVQRSSGCSTILVFSIRGRPILV